MSFFRNTVFRSLNAHYTLRNLNFSHLYSSTANINQLIKQNKVVVFMKGVPDAPRCGFSNAVVQILKFHGVDNYDSHNVLEDENLRQGIKDFSNWPTIPQVYLDGEFVGGCDIMMDMHKNGELIEALAKVGIKSALIDKEPLEKT